MDDDSQTLQQSAPEIDRWMVETQFDYTNLLLERIERRANYIMVASSILLLAHFRLLDAAPGQGLPGVLSGPWYVAAVAMSPAILLVFVIMMSIKSVLPMVLTEDVPINQSRISRLNSREYWQQMTELRGGAAVRAFALENRVLAHILERKSAWVNRAAIALFGSVLMEPLCFLLTVVWSLDGSPDIQ